MFPPEQLHCREVSILRRNEHWSGAILRLFREGRGALRYYCSGSLLRTTVLVMFHCCTTVLMWYCTTALSTALQLYYCRTTPVLLYRFAGVGVCHACTPMVPALPLPLPLPATDSATATAKAITNLRRRG